MGATIIDGTTVSRHLRFVLPGELDAVRRPEVDPGLASVVVDDDCVALAHERRLWRRAAEVGFRFQPERLPDDAEPADVLATIGKPTADPRVTGILTFRPLPVQPSEVELYATLDLLKYVEAVRPANVRLIAVDVGINPVENERGQVHLVGDLDSAAQQAEALTPVLGGVGPVTDVWLVRNAVLDAVLQQPSL